MSVSSPARFGLPPTATGPQYVAYIFGATWGEGEGPLPLAVLLLGMVGSHPPSLGQSIPPSAEQWHNIAQCPNFTHWPPFPISSEVRETQASRGDSTAPQEAKAVRIRMCRPVHVPKELSMHGARAAFGPASRPATEGQVVLELAHYPPPSHFPGRGG